jgi:hypothetical protein
MKYTVITTFNQRGLAEYGQRMINTFEQYWPSSVDLVIYTENCTPIVKRANTRVLDIFQSSAECTAFVSKHKDNSEANGGRGPHNQAFWNPKKSFRWQAVRFCYKVFAINHALDTTDTDWVIWLDADTHTHSPVSAEWLQSLCPDEYMSCYLGRDNYHSECGWIAYNKHHTNISQFVNGVAAMYTSDAIFNYPEWHDSYIWDRVREQYNQSMFYNLNPFPNTKGLAKHPFINSKLGECMDHVKGARKENGHSKKIDITMHIGHPYWQNIISKNA